MTLRIEVRPRTADHDAAAASIVRDALPGLEIDEVDAVRTCALYFVRGPIEDDPDAVDRLVDELLVDPVTQVASWHPLDARPAERPARLAHVIEVSARPGITDTEAVSLRLAARDHGYLVDDVATGMRYELYGRRRDLRPGHAARVERLASTLLANVVVQNFTIDTPVPPPFIAVHAATARVERFDLGAMDDAALVALSMQRRLALDLDEMRAIQQHFAETLQREVTDVELETIAQTWSEHCAHKTFDARIELHASHVDGHGDPEVIDGLLRLLRASTDALARPWVRSAFVDNAGVIALTDALDLALKVETHNHPSALDPFGGANTGVGGVVRDILGVSARPIANLDVLCFGPPDLAPDLLPDGVLHPTRVRRGVVSGIEDYGNKMGIPTVAGAVLYDPGYTTNPLVYCGCIGVAPPGSHPRQPRTGDRVVVIGGRTGRDGLRGATFSSMGLDEATAEVSGSAVQIGHPIHEKQLQEVILRARDERLYHAITDCGAGGLSSAVGEMAAALGADIELGEVSLAYDGLAPWEIWLSESQERMVLAVPDAHWARLADLCAIHRVGLCCIGRFCSDGLLTVRCGGEVVARLSGDFLHGGAPRRHLVASWEPPEPVLPDPLPTPSRGLGHWLLQLLASDELCSRAAIVRRFDHEVQGGTVGRPLVGPGNGPGDGAVVVPGELWRTHTAGHPLPGVAIGIGIQPWIGEVDPYAMAWAVVDEALRNAVAAGADPDHTALLDNFCWGDARDPHALGALARCVQGCHDAALAYGTPFVSGKDSLNNVYADAEGYTSTIPGTLLVTAVGRVPDVRRRTASALTSAGHVLYLLGSTREELGASTLARGFALERDDVPQPASLTGSITTMRALHATIAAGHVTACHDLSGGGLAVALAEMAIAGQLGARIELARIDADTAMSDAALCFSESTGRFLVEVAPEHVDAFEAAMDEISGARIGTVTAAPSVEIIGQDGETVIDEAVDALAAAWSRPRGR